MADRRDRLAGMTGLPPANAPAKRVDATVVAPRVIRRQALLYVPAAGEDATARITARLSSDLEPPSRRTPRISSEIDTFILKVLKRSREERWPDSRSAASELRSLIRTLS